MKPSGKVVGLLIFTPIIITFLTVMTCGFGGLFVLIGLSVVAVVIDMTPSPPVWATRPEFKVRADLNNSQLTLQTPVYNEEQKRRIYRENGL